MIWILRNTVRALTRQRNIISGAATLLLVSCSSGKVVTSSVPAVHTDTVYLNSLQYDSVFIRQERNTDRTRDTVVIHDTFREYRYKLLRDTVRLVKRDSIPYSVTVVETKEVPRKRTLLDYLSYTALLAVIASLALWIIRRTY